MRVVKLSLISFVVFFGIITAMSLLIPSHIRLSRATNLLASPGVIFSRIINQSRWPEWHPAFRGPAGDSLLRQHNIAFTTLVQNDSLVRMQWQQQGRAPVINSWQLHHFSTSDSVALQWYMDFRLKWYPWQKFSSLFYESTYGRMMEQGLQNIKSAVQAE